MGIAVLLPGVAHITTSHPSSPRTGPHHHGPAAIGQLWENANGRACPIMNSVIRTARVVAHCLAIWNTYAGSLSQKDKDFFDACVEHASFADEFSAVEECITERLLEDGLKSDEVVERAHQLVTPYAAGWGVEMPALARAH